MPLHGSICFFSFLLVLSAAVNFDLVLQEAGERVEVMFMPNGDLLVVSGAEQGNFVSSCCQAATLCMSCII